MERLDFFIMRQSSIRSIREFKISRVDAIVLPMRYGSGTRGASSVSSFRLVLSAVLALLAIETSAQVSHVDYYENSLAVMVGAKVFSGFNQVATIETGAPVLTIRWESLGVGGQSVEQTPANVAKNSQIPIINYIRSDGESLDISGIGAVMQAGPFVSGRARLLPADREALFGYIGVDGSWAIKPRFVHATDFHLGYAAAHEPGGKWGIIDVNGKWILAPTLSYIDDSLGFPYFWLYAADGSSSYWDIQSRTIIPYDDKLYASYTEEIKTANRIECLGGWNVKEDRRADWNYGGTALYVRVIRRDGMLRSAGIFNAVPYIHGSLAVVALGYSNSFRNPSPVPEALFPNQGAYGLIDLETGKFLIPPDCRQIIHLQGDSWYVLPHGGMAYRINLASGLRETLAADFPVNWIVGSVVCGSIRWESAAAPGVPAGELNVRGFVNDDQVRLRTQPNTKSPIVAGLSKGTFLQIRGFKAEVETIGEWTGIWMRVETNKNQKGWVFGYFIDMTYQEGP
jgi:hypothetical protein